MWVTRSILADALGWDTTGNTAKLQELDVPTASVSVVEYCSDPGSPTCVIYMGKKPPVLESTAGDGWGG